MEGRIIADKYKILRSLGYGATGSVYVCENLVLGTYVTVKAIKKGKSKEALYKNEEKILKLINHHGIPHLFDIAEDKENIYFFLDYIDGITLDRLLKTYNSFDENQVIEWLMQLCDILYYLHNQKPHPIIYRDLKPANIMITKDNKVMLVDFDACSISTSKAAPDKIVAGTTIYSAPEQLIMGEITDQRTDIYCVGILAYELLLGSLPKSNSEFILKDISIISRGLKRIIRRCLEKERHNRYSSIINLKDELEKQYRLNITRQENDYNKIRLLPYVIGGLSIITYIFAILGFVSC